MTEGRFVISSPQRKRVFKQAKMTNKVPHNSPPIPLLWSNVTKIMLLFPDCFVVPPRNDGVHELVRHETCNTRKSRTKPELDTAFVCGKCKNVLTEA